MVTENVFDQAVGDFDPSAAAAETPRETHNSAGLDWCVMSRAELVQALCRIAVGSDYSSMTRENIEDLVMLLNPCMNNQL